MKKKVIAIALISGLTFATVASANWGRGNGGWGYGNGTCLQQGQFYNQVDPAIQEKMDKFSLDTQDLRRTMAIKQAEKMALLRTANPDPAAVSRLTGEIFDLRTELKNKADEAGVSAYMGPRGGRGFGRGMGMGPGGGPGRGMMGGGYRY